MNREFIQALDDLEREKHIPKTVLLEAIESALVSAYKKDYKEFKATQNVRVDIDDITGEINVYAGVEVVDEIEDEYTQMSLEEAHEIDPRYEIGDIIEYQVTPKDFGRIAAQAAKQVVVQRIREAERSMVYDSFIERQGDIVTGKVERISNDNIFVDLNGVEAILTVKDQVRGESYRVNDRIKVYILDVRKPNKGPQIILSRSHAGFVSKLFELEVPEMEDGTVVIKGIAREAGSRTKMAVYTEFENVDAVGACVGTGGNRVRAVVDELHGEKIDIIEWSENPVQLITSVLSPAKVERVIITDEEKRIATVVVSDSQLSLAIGREGQNVRLAARVSGWKIDIKSHSKFMESPELFEVDKDEDEVHFDDEEAGMEDSEASEEFCEMNDEAYVEEAGEEDGSDKDDKGDEDDEDDNDKDDEDDADEEGINYL